MKHKILATIIIAIATMVAIASVWDDAPIVDEVPHIGAGWSYVAKQTFLFNPEHPPLVKDLAGLPLLTLNIDEAVFERQYQGGWPTDVNGQWNFGRALIYQSGVEAQKLVHFAKLPMFLFFILSGVLIFVWTSRLYGGLGGLLALFLFSFSPTIIAHSRFVTTDAAALTGILAATFFFIRYLKEPGNQWYHSRSFWLAAIIFGLAQLTKFSVILLIPYFLFLGVLWGWANGKIFKNILNTILVMAIGMIVTIGPLYQLHLLNYPGSKQKADTEIILSGPGNQLIKNSLTWASDKPILRPYAEYGLGLAMVFHRNAGGNRTYFLGEVYNEAQKSYFPVVYLLKEPLPILVLMAIAILFVLIRRRPKNWRARKWLGEHFAEVAMLIWITFYWWTSINANLNIGIRHLLPVFGFTYILVAGQVATLAKNLKLKAQNHSSKSKVFNFKFSFYAFRFTLFVLIVWYLIEFVSAYPYYLTYFNQLAGGPSGGHRYVVDSNLDWGQDLKRLGDWTKERGIQKISVDYFGWADQKHYIGDAFYWVRNAEYTSAEQFLRGNPQGGYIAVSVTFYQESIHSNGNYNWLKAYKPVANIGNSIFVWHISTQ